MRASGQVEAIVTDLDGIEGRVRMLLLSLSRGQEATAALCGEMLGVLHLLRGYEKLAETVASNVQPCCTLVPCPRCILEGSSDLH